MKRYVALQQTLFVAVPLTGGVGSYVVTVQHELAQVATRCDNMSGPSPRVEDA